MQNRKLRLFAAYDEVHSIETQTHKHTRTNVNKPVHRIGNLID